jgi:hypothetical protein
MIRPLLAVVLLVPGLLAARPAALTSADPCAIEGVERIVAIGDVHGAYDEFVRILQAAKLVDGRQRWAGGRAVLIQTGDTVDRGDESRKVLDLLRRLERDAPRAGGRVLALVGNHEVMRLAGDYRDMSPGEVDAFRTARSPELRDTVRANWLEGRREAAEAAGTGLDEKALVADFDAQTPLGFIELLNAFSQKGDYGKWIRGHHAAARVNGILFLHGGVSPRVAPLGCAGINAGVQAEIAGGLDGFRNAPLESLAGSVDGPLWYRGLALEEEAVFAPEVEKILDAVGAKAIVVGHTVTPTGRITPRFGRKVVQIDTGMLTRVYKGRPSALEIAGDRWTAIYEDGRRPLTAGQ